MPKYQITFNISGKTSPTPLTYIVVAPTQKIAQERFLDRPKAFNELGKPTIIKITEYVEPFKVEKSEPQGSSLD